MKKVKLFLYNYGRITQIADFKDAGHDASICLMAMNDNQLKATNANGNLSEDIFYFLQWKGKHNTHISVGYSGISYGSDLHELKVKTLFNNSIINSNKL